MKYEELTPCTDNGCIIRRRRGMGTTGGCRCERELRREMRAGHLGGVRAIEIIRAMRDRIEKLESQLSDAKAEIAGLRNQIVGAGGTPDPKYGDRA